MVFCIYLWDIFPCMGALVIFEFISMIRLVDGNNMFLYCERDFWFRVLLPLSLFELNIRASVYCFVSY
jgi:hypothetical protein